MYILIFKNIIQIAEKNGTRTLEGPKYEFL